MTEDTTRHGNGLRHGQGDTDTGDVETRTLRLARSCLRRPRFRLGPLATQVVGAARRSPGRVVAISAPVQGRRRAELQAHTVLGRTEWWQVMAEVREGVAR